MSDPNLFDQEPQPTPEDQAPIPEPSPTTESEYLEKLVGEGKKFKTVDDLARGKIEADEFIERLKQEQQQLREELEKRVGLEEKLDSLLKAQHKPDPSNQSQPPQQPQVDDLDIDKLIDERMTARERAALESKNFEESQRAIVDHCGGDGEAARRFIQERAKELGVSPEYLGQRAKESKSAFLALVGIASKPQPVPSTPRGTTGDAPVQHGQPQPGTWEYFEALRKSDPKRYFSPKVQQELHKAVREGRIQL